MIRVTPLITRFRAGSRSAFAELFTTFYRRQVGQAAVALRGRGRPGLFDPDDVAQGAFHALWQEVLAGNFADRLERTEGFLGVLTILTAQQVARARRYDRQKKRDTARTVGIPDQFQVAGADPGGCEEADLVLQLPPSLSERQQTIIRMLVEGWERDAIATRIGVSVRTIDREIADSRAIIRDHLAGVTE